MKIEAFVLARVGEKTGAEDRVLVPVVMPVSVLALSVLIGTR